MSFLRHLWIWRHHLGLRPSDVFLASFPRSGSTWLSFLLHGLCGGEKDESGFRAVDTTIAGIGHHSEIERTQAGGGRLIRTHYTYRPRYRNAIFMVRDPRDVMLSLCEYNAFLNFQSYDLDTSQGKFIDGTLEPFGGWKQHVESWLNSGLTLGKDLFWIRYEDMKKDPIAILAGLMDFLGHKRSPEQIAEVVENNRIEKMRKREEEAGVGYFGVVPTDKRFVGKGEVGGWRDKLTPDQVRRMSDYAGDLMVRLGYDLE